jgi:peptidoglycan/xylan/chitin deacetylase (PgdA/CDA1 family)
MNKDFIKKLIKSALQSILGNRFLIYTIPGNKPVVALTFDDGPHSEYTALVLDVLRKNNVKGTFFLTGKAVEDCADLVRQIIKEGHCVGNHSYAHQDFSRISYGEIKDEILTTQKVFYETLGVGVNILRPPHGIFTFQQLFFCIRHSIKTILWSYDSRDYQYKGEAYLKERLDKTRLCNGDIFLLHDDNMFTVNFLQYLIDRARRDGFEFVTIGDL